MMINHIDNLEFLRDQPCGSFPLIVTSPPYNIGKEYEKTAALDVYREGQRSVIHECVRTLAPGGSICWQVGNYVTNGEVWPLDLLLFDLFRDAGLVMRNRIIWTFDHGLHCTKRLSGRHETVMWWTRPGLYRFDADPIRVPSKYPNKRHFKGPKKGQLSGNPLGKNPGDVWIIPNVKANHCEKTEHPCQFPVELVERLVLSMTNVGDVVFDPYAGVGSSLIAAEKNARKGVGCEIRQDYVDIGNRRLLDLERGDLKTRPMGKPVFQPIESKEG